MDLETRVSNLEELTMSLMESVNNHKFYTDADIASIRQQMSSLREEIKSLSDRVTVLEEEVNNG